MSLNPLNSNTLANPSKMSKAEIIHVLECAYQALQYKGANKAVPMLPRIELKRAEEWVAEALRGLRMLEGKQS